MVHDVSIQITVVYSPWPREVREIVLTLEAGGSVRQALIACSLETFAPALDINQAVIGVWGRKADMDQPLEDRDRVEVYRPLKINPKIARRERFAKQGSRGAGLFANRRAGSKAGY
jgi:putative ubiquitin-RnfH superfamily antitoxin RatB of RatAB toxin-antitoxin module